MNKKLRNVGSILGILSLSLTGGSPSVSRVNAYRNIKEMMMKMKFKQDKKKIEHKKFVRKVGAGTGLSPAAIPPILYIFICSVVFYNDINSRTNTDLQKNIYISLILAINLVEYHSEVHTSNIEQLLKESINTYLCNSQLNGTKNNIVKFLLTSPGYIINKIINRNKLNSIEELISVLNKKSENSKFNVKEMKSLKVYLDTIVPMDIKYDGEDFTDEKIKEYIKKDPKNPVYTYITWAKGSVGGFYKLLICNRNSLKLDENYWEGLK